MEVPRPGIKSEPQLEPTPELWQWQILNDRSTVGTPDKFNLNSFLREKFLGLFQKLIKRNKETICQVFFPPFFGLSEVYGVPWPGIRSELLLLSRLQLQQRQILNPLCWARDWTCVSVLPGGCWSHCNTTGTPTICQFCFLGFFFSFYGRTHGLWKFPG